MTTNPAHLAHSWLTAFAEPLGLRAQIEYSSTKEMATYHLLVGSVKAGRCELGSIVRECGVWYPLTVAGVVCDDSDAMMMTLNARRQEWLAVAAEFVQRGGDNGGDGSDSELVRELS